MMRQREFYKITTRQRAPQDYDAAERTPQDHDAAERVPYVFPESVLPFITLEVLYLLLVNVAYINNLLEICELEFGGFIWWIYLVDLFGGFIWWIYK